MRIYIYLGGIYYNFVEYLISNPLFNKNNISFMSRDLHNLFQSNDCNGRSSGCNELTYDKEMQ